MSHSNRLRELLAGPDAIIAPGCYDAFTALLIEQAGFPCAYLSGASISYSRLGRPDIGLTTLSEVADTVANIRERISLPLIVDADNGFGNALNVQRTVRLLERMGASAVQLEDQTLPKRCGHLSGKTLVPVAEMTGKLRAALDARQDDALLIIARTDAVAVEGLDAGIERAAAYIEAGADVLFVEALESHEQLARIGELFGRQLPLLANMVEGGRTPLLDLAELDSLGYRLVIYPGALMRVLGHAGAAWLAGLQAQGSSRALRDQMLDFDQLNELIGTAGMLRAGERYR